MKIKLLLFCGVLLLLNSNHVFAQSLKITAQTSSFTDYEIRNEMLEVHSPISLNIPFNAEKQYQVLEQSIVSIPNNLSDDEINARILATSDTPIIELSNPAYFNGKSISSLIIHRARVTETEVSVIKLLKIRVYNNVSDKSINRKKSTVLSSSIFATGDWYKIPVRDNKVYQLNSEYLQNLGIDISNIDPRKIQLWGTDGYPLPEANNEARSQLSQIPIIVEGENDGSFDAQDRVIFYGNSPHKTFRNLENFLHELNPYSDENYVFLTIADENGLRISVSNQGIVPTSTVSTFTDFVWKDEELVKPEERFKSGRFWLGQTINSIQSNSSISVFKDTLLGVSPTSNIRVVGRMYARSEQLMTFDVDLNGTDVSSRNVSSLSSSNSSQGYNGSEGRAASVYNFAANVTTNIPNGILDLTSRVTIRDNNGQAFVDWIRISLDRELIAENNYLYIYTEQNNNPVAEVTYQLKNFNTNPYVFDVTDPLNPTSLNTRTSGSNLEFDYYQNDGRQIVAQSVPTVPSEGFRISNQDLKGITSYPDYIIVTSEALLAQAQSLAEYRSQKGLFPYVVTQEQIFNEFSGGLKDPVAIRDFLKFLNDRAIANGERNPKLLLLFGDTSYDYKGIVPNALTNHVVTYESIESTHRTLTFGTDDFYGYLDDEEGNFASGDTPTSHYMDIGIGRITVQTRSEAEIYIEKIKRYESDENSGDWQNLFTFAADDDLPEANRNRDLHVINADVSAQNVRANESGIRTKKIYTLSYPAEITGAGRQIPEATNDFIESVNNGTLVLSYSGHGNEQTLSDEELFLSDYIPNFTNSSKLCVLVTATCQFGRYDDTQDQSGAEKFVLASNGGGIAAFTTTRVVYTSSSISSNNNFALSVSLSQRISERKTDGSPKTLGEVFRETKNSILSNGARIGATVNNKKFVLIGDPGVQLKLPSKNASITNINSTDVSNLNAPITIKALEEVVLQGRVENENGEVNSSYNGQATVSIFDTPRRVSLPDREWNCVLNGDCTYSLETNLLFNGKASVQNGLFNLSLIIPKDISTLDGNGRIVIYTDGENGNGYAGGSFTDIEFDGVNQNAVNDGKGPELDIYLNDEKFVNGNLVNDSPTLIVELNDETGINTSGTGVGHEIIATIDTKPQQTFILNEFFEGNLNDFKSGRIEYPLDQIPEGNYSLKVRAWDVQNNPTEKEIFFEVASKNELSVKSVYNYPNPMNNSTQFVFEHNQPGNPMDVQIKIFTLSGKPVHTIKQESLITTNSYANIPWNGRDRDNDRLGNGTYIYVLRIEADTPEGKQQFEKIEKLVIIR